MPVSPDYSAIVNGQTIDPTDVTTPMTQIANFANTLETNLNTEITNRGTGDNNLRDGLTAIERLVLGTTQSVTIASGVISLTTKTRYIVDTQGGAASDDLDTMTGMTNGQLIILQIANNARQVVVRHDIGTGGFLNSSGANVTLDSTNKTWVGVYNSTSGRALQITDPTNALRLREGIATTPIPAPLLTVPNKSIVQTGYGAPRLEVQPSLVYQNGFAYRASAAAIQPVGVAAPSSIGTPVLTLANQPDNTYVQVATIATINTVSGIASPTFNLFQRRHNPIWEFLFQPSSDNLNLRYWFGMFSAQITNVDDPATACIAFRYSTTAGDGNFRGVCDDGTTMSITGDVFPTMSVLVPTLLRIRVDNANNTVYFSINDGNEVSLSANLPLAAQDLGVAAYVINNVASTKNYLFGVMTLKYAG